MLTSNDALLTNHDEFRKLAQEHMQYSTRLDSLTQKRYLSEDEKLEEIRLKKLKLRLKDQMQSIEPLQAFCIYPTPLLSAFLYLDLRTVAILSIQGFAIGRSHVRAEPF
jgi:uncharacterized protein YdcH (DUF465 family)